MGFSLNVRLPLASFRKTLRPLDPTELLYKEVAKQIFLSLRKKLIGSTPKVPLAPTSPVVIPFICYVPPPLPSYAPHYSSLNSLPPSLFPLPPRLPALPRTQVPTDVKLYLDAQHKVLIPSSGAVCVASVADDGARVYGRSQYVDDVLEQMVPEPFCPLALAPQTSI